MRPLNPETLVLLVSRSRPTSQASSIAEKIHRAKDSQKFKAPTPLLPQLHTPAGSPPSLWGDLFCRSALGGKRPVASRAVDMPVF
jgi:hypothetical protein